MSAVQAPKVLLEGLAIGESPRWHAGRLWLSNWGTQEILAVDPAGGSEVALRLPFTAIPFSIDWLPDGRMLIVSASSQPLLAQAQDGSLAPYADLGRLPARIWNEIVVDGRGNTYINGSSTNSMAGEPFVPGIIALVAPDGAARPVADGIAFPNGMAVTPDNATLIIAESYARQLTAFDIAADGSLTNRRVWAVLENRFPDGICVDAEGAVWYADVPNQCCVRVREGGEELQKIDLDRGCFACMLGGTDTPTLFMLAAKWGGFSSMAEAGRNGQVLAAPAPAPGAGWPGENR